MTTGYNLEVQFPLLGVREVNWFYYGGRVISWVIFTILTRWRVKGRENVPRQGPLIIVANHIHALDPPLLGIAIKRKMVFMAKEELFRSRLIAYFIRGYGAFPVRRGGVDRKALRQAEEALARTYQELVAPSNFTLGEYIEQEEDLDYYQEFDLSEE